ncbi:uncharacterized protein FFNC_15426 [Fusarium fujikuroi]|nr:uncharacterized protein FFNC_15426 [Fusarium fujikuroi]
MYLTKGSVHGFNEPGFQSAIRAFLRAYGIPDTPETTDPQVEEWGTYAPLLFYRRFLLYIEQARSSRWWKLKDSECKEIDQHMRTLLRHLHRINKWRERTVERDIFFENVENGGPILQNQTDKKDEEDEEDEEDKEDEELHRSG